MGNQVIPGRGRKITAAGPRPGTALGADVSICYISGGVLDFLPPSLGQAMLSIRRAGRFAAVWVLPWLLLPGAAGWAADDAETLRVETEVFDGDADTPLARSLTLFAREVAWDFLAVSATDGNPPVEQSDDGFGGEIILHDPARERVVLIDPRRNIRTTVDAIQLERLSVSLATWARQSDDKLICWAGGPGFGEGVQEEDGQLELVGPRVRYHVKTIAAPTPDLADRYRRFADTAVLLRALLHPGGVPPFPRLAINRAVAAADNLPAEVTLDTDPRGGFSGTPLAGVMQRRLRSVHRMHPALRSDDLKRIADAEACMAAAKEVDLAAYTQAEAD